MRREHRAGEGPELDQANELVVHSLGVCDGSIAVVHDQLNDPAIVSGGAWEWNGFGFDTAPDIPGIGTPGCADIDGYGRSEPVIADR